MELYANYISDIQHVSRHKKKLAWVDSLDSSGLEWMQSQQITNNKKSPVIRKS